MIKRPAFFNLKTRPYDLLGLSALLLFLLSFLCSNDAVDIITHDTYFVLPDIALYQIFAGVLLFLWLASMMVRKVVFSQSLTWVQIVLTLIAVGFFLQITFRNMGLNGVPRRYYSFTEFEKQSSWFTANHLYPIIVCTFLLGQMVFLANVIRGSLRRFSRRSVIKD